MGNLDERLILRIQDLERRLAALERLEIPNLYALLGMANVFTESQTIRNTAPGLSLMDTTAGAKSLVIVVDANVADFRESAGISGSLLLLDLVNNRIGIGRNNPGFHMQMSGPGVQQFVIDTTDNVLSSVSSLEQWADNPRLIFGAHGSARTISRFGLTLGGWAEIRLDQGSATPNGLIVGTVQNAPIVLGTNNTERMRIAAAGDVSLKSILTAYNNVATEGYGIGAIVDDVALINQAADIGSMNFTNAGTAGTYLIDYYLETTTADAAAGAVMLIISFTDDVGATSQSSAALTLVSTGRTSGRIYVRLASGSIAYSTTHTGNYGTAKYALHMTCTRVR